LIVPENVFRSGFVMSGDVRIHTRTIGKPGKTPVIIVHGMSFFSYDWIGVAQRLAGDREVAAMDQRGFGDSDWSPARKYDLRQQAADVVAVLDHHGWEKAILMGHSAGGRICLCTASWYPERARAFVSVDFAPDLAPAGRRKVAEQIGRQPDVFASVDEALQYHRQDTALPSDAPVRNRFEAFLKPVAGGYALKRDLHYRDQFKQVLDTGKSHPPEVDAWALLKALTIPVLVVRASCSDLFAEETMDKVRAANVGAEVVQVEGSHDLARDNPEALSRIVGGFLARVG
jgi:pimeloyl-ACP methyl ester carboxylesterase